MTLRSAFIHQITDGSLRQKLAWWITCLLPLALLHSRAGAEIGIAAIDLLYLAGRPRPRGAFVAAAAAWWAWGVLTSLGTPGVWLALALIRLPLLSVALANDVLATAGRRRVLWWLLAASAGWIALQCWQQVLTGHNLFGQPPYGDGALTGPFAKPRAGPALILLFFPVMGTAVAALLARRRRIAATALLAAGVATQVLIGQRMPALLLALGLVITALRMRAARLPLLAAGAMGAVLVAALPVVSPATYDKLVVQFREQAGAFWSSAYGQLWRHAAAMIRARPLTGHGFDAFRRDCPVSAALAHDWCNIHPHNFYVEQAVNGGLPLAALFAAMAIAAVLALRRAVGFFVGACIAFWPFATTSALASMPNGGWIFLLLGVGFAFSGKSRALPEQAHEAILP